MKFLRVFVVIIFALSLLLNLGCGETEETVTQDEPTETVAPDVTDEEAPADTTATEEAPTEEAPAEESTEGN